MVAEEQRAGAIKKGRIALLFVVVSADLADLVGPPSFKGGKSLSVQDDHGGNEPQAPDFAQRTSRYDVRIGGGRWSWIFA